MTDLKPSGDLEEFRAALKPALGVLKLDSPRYYEALGEVAGRFLKNRRLDISPTDATILRDLKEACERPASKLGVHMLTLSDAVTDALFGEFPGNTYILETWDDDPKQIYLPDHDALFGEATKSLWRRDAAPEARGMIDLIRAPHIAACIPRDMSAGRLTATLNGLVDLIISLTANEALRERLYGFASVLIEGAGHDDASFTRECAAALGRAVEDGTLVAHLKAAIPDMATRYGARSCVPEELSARSFCVATFKALVAESDRVGRRSIVKAIAELFPEEFRSYLVATAGRIRAQYQAEVGGGGRPRSAHRWMFAHASWILIHEVMDVVWPPEKGSLAKESSPTIFEIAEIVLEYADPSINEGTNPDISKPAGQGATGHVPTQRRANFGISADSLSTIASLRSNIFMLDEVLFEMNRCLTRMEKATLRHGSLASEKEIDLRRRVEALQSWRREAQRRLRQGDWEKGKKAADKKRITGPRVSIPEFSLRLKNLPMAHRIVAASDLALGMGLGPVTQRSK